MRQMTEAAQRALDQEIEAHASVRDRQLRGKHGDPVVHRSWNATRPGLRVAERPERIVPSKKLVSAVSSERNSYLSTGMPTKHIGRQQRGIRNRFIPARSNFWQQA